MSRCPSFSYTSLIQTSTGFAGFFFEGMTRTGFSASSSSVIEGEIICEAVVAGFTGSGLCTAA